MINKAIQFASLCHSDQVRKASQIPYILHPLEAGIIASSLSRENTMLDEDIVASAILHDVCEDAKISLASLELIFNNRVARLVELQSEDKSKTWKERKQHTLSQLKDNKDKALEIVILADKLSNLRSIKRDYQEIGNKLWERFNVKDKSQHEWYYAGILKNIKQLSHTQEYKEFQKLLLEVFNQEEGSDDFMVNSKFKGYYNEEGFAVDIKYEVEINFKNMPKKDIENLVKKELRELDILDINNNYVKLLWPIEAYGEPEEIEVEMYYFLDNGKLGDYNYYRVN